MLPRTSLRCAVAAALGFALLAVLAQAGYTRSWDDAGLRLVLGIRTPGLTSAMRAVSSAGGGLILGLFFLVFVAWLGRSRGRRTATFYTITCLSGWALYALLKLGLARTRPVLISRLDGAGWSSFPSGHAMVSTIFFGLAVILVAEAAPRSVISRVSAAAGGLLIAAIAVSRVYLGVHYPSDVVAGVLAGLAWVLGALYWLRAGTGRVPPAPAAGMPPVSQTSETAAER